MARPTYGRLFRRGSEDPDRRSSAEGGSSEMRIRCPACSWVPDGKAHWVCEECSAVFDTFATRAHCPRCPNSWTFTWCPACDAISDHEDWYERTR